MRAGRPDRQSHHRAPCGAPVVRHPDRAAGTRAEWQNHPAFSIVAWSPGRKQVPDVVNLYPAGC